MIARSFMKKVFAATLGLAVLVGVPVATQAEETKFKPSRSNWLANLVIE